MTICYIYNIAAGIIFSFPGDVGFVFRPPELLLLILSNDIVSNHINFEIPY